jgi:chorismate synthase
MLLRFLTAGDSHGDSLIGIIEGLPAGVRLSARAIRRDLLRRSRVYGRGSRQKVEGDHVEILSGLWKGRTTGAPVALRIPNRGRTGGGGLSTTPRPGHADLAGCLKYGLLEVTPISERASARGTAMRTAVGAVARAVLDPLSVVVVSHVRSIGEIDADPGRISIERLQRRADRSPVHSADGRAGRRMMEAIRMAEQEGHSLGGSAEVIAAGVPPGLGSHVEWDRKLDARLAGALMSIPSVKAVEIGDGLETHRWPGPEAQDAITLERGRIRRTTNFAGGIEGGISNGEDIVVRVYAKPIPTSRKALPSVNLRTLTSRRSPYVRSDVCVVPAIAVIAEAATAWELLRAFLEKFGGDHIDETGRNLRAYRAALAKRSRG